MTQYEISSLWMQDTHRPPRLHVYQRRLSNKKIRDFSLRSITLKSLNVVLTCLAMAGPEDGRQTSIPSLSKVASPIAMASYGHAHDELIAGPIVDEFVTKMTVGTTTAHVDVTITESALRLLDQLPSSTGKRDLHNYRPLLTVLAIGRAAAGRLVDGAMTVEAMDIANILGGDPRRALEA